MARSATIVCRGVRSRTMNQPSTVGFAVIGCGVAAWTGHLPWIWSHSQARLVVTCDRDILKAEQARRRWNAAFAVTDPMEAMRCEGVQAVCICTPPATHRELGCAAASLGRHVLMEKPVGRSVEECDALAEAARAARTLMVPAHEKRFHVAAGKIRQLIEGGAIGKVFHLTLHWGASVKLDPERLIPDGYRDGYLWRWKDPETGGGILQDHLPHYVDLWRWWTGSEVESVCAEAQHISRDYLNQPEIGQWEDFGSVLMRFADGAVGTFHTGTAGRGLSPILHNGSGVGEWSEFGYLLGTRGQIAFDFPPWDSPEQGRIMVWSLEQKQPSCRGWYQVELPDPRRSPGGPLSPATNESHMFYRQMDAFVQAVLGGRPPELGPADGRATLAVIDAVYQSHRTGQKVRVHNA